MINIKGANNFSFFFLSALLLSTLPDLSCGSSRKRQKYIKTFIDSAEVTPMGEQFHSDNEFFPKTFDSDAVLFDRLLAEFDSLTTSMSYNNKLSSFPTQNPSAAPSVIPSSSTGLPSASPSKISSTASNAAQNSQLRLCDGHGSYEDSSKQSLIFYYQVETSSNDISFLETLENSLRSYTAEKMCNTRRSLWMKHNRQLTLVGINSLGTDEIVNDDCESTNGNFCFVVRSTFEVGVVKSDTMESMVNQTLSNVEDFMLNPPEELKTNTNIVGLSYLGTDDPSIVNTASTISSQKRGSGENVGFIVGVASGSAALVASIAIFLNRRNSNQKQDLLLPLDSLKYSKEDTDDNNDIESYGHTDDEDNDHSDIHTMVTVKL